jgi:hypothetical protein
MSKVGSIFVEVRGDFSKWKEDMNVLKADMKKSGNEVSDALNNAISTPQANKAIQDLQKNLMQLGASAKVPADSFRITSEVIGKSLTDVAKSAGLTEKEFAKLTERMLQTQASKNAEKALNDIGKAAGLSSAEMQKLGTQMGMSSDQLKRMGGNVTESTGLLGRLKESWMALSAAAIGAYMAIGKAREYMQMGAMAQQAESSFRIVAEASGESADYILREMKRVSAGTIEESDIMQKALKGMALGLSGDQMIKIMESARVSARLTGESVLTAYETITDAIATNLPRALRRYGLVTKEEMALVNKAIAAGIEDVGLYEIAMLNATLQAAKMGDMQANAAEQMQRSHAEMKKIGEWIGSVLLTALQKGLGGFQWLASGILTAGYAATKFLSIFSKGWKETSEEFWGAASELMNKAMANISGMSEASSKASKEEIEAAKDAKKAWEDKLKTQIGAIDAANKAAKEAAELEKLLTKQAEETAVSWGIFYDAQMEALNEADRQYAKTMKEWTKLEEKSADEMTKSWQIYYEQQENNMEEGIEAQRKTSDEVWKITRKLAEDMAKFSGDNAAERIKLLDKQLSEYERYLGKTKELDDWYNQQKTLILEDEAQKGDDFWAGLSAASAKHYREEDKAGKLASTLFNDYLSERNKGVSQFVDNFMAGQNAMVSAQKAAGDMMTNLAGDISKRMWSAMIDKVIGMIGAHIGGGAALVAWQGANKGGVAGALVEIATYLGTAVAAMLAGKAMAKSFKAEGGWISEHPMGGWIQQGSGSRDDVFLGNTGNIRHWGMRDEFIVNKNAASKYAPLLMAINSNHAEGGPVGTRADWTGIADSLVSGSGFSFLHGFYKGVSGGPLAGIIAGILEAIAFNATAIPLMFISKYAADKFRSEGGWMDVGHGFFDFIPSIHLPFHIPTLPGLPGFLQPNLDLDMEEAKKMILDIVRSPYEQVAKDILTPNKYFSEPLAGIGNNLSNLYRISNNLFMPKFHGGIDYVPNTGPAMLEEGERVVPRGKNIRGERPLQIIIPVNLNGREIGRVLYDESKAGHKFIHERGITNR